MSPEEIVSKKAVAAENLRGQLYTDLSMYRFLYITFDSLALFFDRKTSFSFNTIKLKKNSVNQSRMCFFTVYPFFLSSKPMFKSIKTHITSLQTYVLVARQVQAECLTFLTTTSVCR